jgi:hypothetical protein
VPVIMVLRLKCDPDALERFANANTELMDGLSARPVLDVRTLTGSSGWTNVRVWTSWG